MNSPIIDQHISICDASVLEIEHYGVDSSQSKYYYMRSLIMEIVSEFEMIIENLFIQKANQSGDSELTNFVRNQLNQKFRSPDLGKIYNILNMLNSARKDQFYSRIQDTDKSAAWNNLLKARHAIVHKQGVLHMTYEEVKSSYIICQIVIDELKNALNV